LFLDIDRKVDNELFHRHLLNQYSEESIYFFKAVRDFQDSFSDESLSPDELHASAVKIFNQYINSKGEYAVNISAKSRQTLYQWFSKEGSEATVSLFDDALIEIVTLLAQDTFPRFGHEVEENIQKSLERVCQLMPAVEFGKLMYKNWFEKQPELKSLFRRDIGVQSEMVMTMIAQLATSLSDIKSLVPVLIDSGRRHRAYGVVPENYASLKVVFMETLQQVLQDELTKKVRESWDLVFSLVAGIMTDESLEKDTFKSTGENSKTNSHGSKRIEEILEASNTKPTKSASFKERIRSIFICGA